MHKVLLLSFILQAVFVVAQTSPSAGNQQTVNRKEFEQTKQAIDSALHPMKYAKTIEEVLQAGFPTKRQNDGQWAFFKEAAGIEELNKPLIKRITPRTSFYKVTLTNYLGYHVNQGTCVVLYDSAKTAITLAEPLWYSGPSEPLIKLFLRHPVGNKDSLQLLLSELHELMQIGSVYRFRQTAVTDTLISFDLGYFKGDTYTTGGNGTASTINYNEDGVWRKIMVYIKDNAIIRYISINPVTRDKEIIE